MTNFEKKEGKTRRSVCAFGGEGGGGGAKNNMTLFTEAPRQCICHENVGVYIYNDTDRKPALVQLVHGLNHSDILLIPIRCN